MRIHYANMSICDTDGRCVDSTVIPSKVRAHISVRIVPDQDLESIAASVQEHLKAQFQRMRSPNKLNVSSS